YIEQQLAAFPPKVSANEQQSNSALSFAREPLELPLSKIDAWRYDRHLAFGDSIVVDQRPLGPVTPGNKVHGSVERPLVKPVLKSHHQPAGRRGVRICGSQRVNF